MMKAVLIIAAVLTGAFFVCGDAAGKDGLTAGWAQLRPEKDYVFMRARASADSAKTPYGMFVFDRKSEKWSAVGVAADFGRAVDFMGEKIEPDDFFYSKQGYSETPFGNFMYRISWKDGRAVIEAEGGNGTAQRFVGPAINGERGGSREYQFKHIAGGRLWFDMRVITDASLYSEGIGYFDTASKKFQIYDAKSIGLRPKESIITRMTGTGRNIWLGVSFCGKESCLDEGALVKINDGLAKPVLYTSDNSGIPSGAILDVMPDEDALWVAASTGFSRWTPGGSGGAVYRIGASLTLAGDAKARLCAACGEAGATLLQPGDIVDIAGFTGDGFYGVSRKRVTGWILLTGEMTVAMYDKTSSKLIIPAGSDAVFLAEDDDTSVSLGKFPAGAKPRTFNIVEKSGNWANVDLSGYLWVPAENAALAVK